MAYTTSTSFVNQFSDTIHENLERGASRLINDVDIETITGEKAFFERTGSFGDMDEINSVHADTQLEDLDQSRRMLLIKDYAKATMLDHQDSIKLLIDPFNVYTRKLSSALGRKIDDVIVAALLGTAQTDKTGSTGVVLPSAQKVAAGGTKVTFAKLLDVSEKFKNNNYYDEIVGYITPTALRQLLEQTEIQSVDYNVMRSLMSGNVETFMGIKFRVCNVPELVDNNKIVFFGKDALKLGLADKAKLIVGERLDKNANPQALLRHSFGAVRMEEELVVEVSHI